MRILCGMFFVGCSLTACVRSGEGALENAQLPETIATFADGSGVLRATSTVQTESRMASIGEPISRSTDGGVYVSIARVPNLEASIANHDEETDLFFLDPTSLQVFGNTQFGTVYKDTITDADGDEFTVSAFTFDGADISLISALSADGKYTIVSGLEPSNIPTTGSFDYTGQYLVAAIDNSFQEGGTFDLALDFENGTGTLSATSSQTSLSGGIEVDVATGKLSASNLVLTAPLFTENASATFEGNLHEAAAASVSGLFYDADGASPSVNGAIIGAR